MKNPPAELARDAQGGITRFRALRNARLHGGGRFTAVPSADCQRGLSE
jgi:hypothetical protein